MQDMQGIADPHGVERADGIAAMVLHQVIDPAAEPYLGLGRIGSAAQLDNE